MAERRLGPMLCERQKVNASASGPPYIAGDVMIMTAITSDSIVHDRTAKVPDEATVVPDEATVVPDETTVVPEGVAIVPDEAANHALS